MHSRFHSAFANLAADLQSALAPILADDHFPAMLSAEQVKVLMELFNGTQRTTRVRMIGTHEHHQSGL